MQTLDDNGLFSENSVADLVARGYSRTYVLERTGVDPGYKNASIRKQMRDIDVCKYRGRHVAYRIDKSVVESVLTQWAEAAITKREAFQTLGMPDLSERVSLRAILQEAGFGAASVAAERARKKRRMDSGRTRAITIPDSEDVDATGKHRMHTRFEHDLFIALVDMFGFEDTIFDDSYGCLFFIKSQNIYIKAMCGYEHGRHWFDETDKEDLARTVHMQSRREFLALDVWTKQDVLFREMAKSNNLSLLCVWDDELRDLKLWFAMDCPEPHDWKREGSWLDLSEVLKNRLEPLIPYSKVTNDRAIITTVRASQRDIVFARELQALITNAKYTHDKRALFGRLQLYVCAYRFDKTGLLPSSLTQMEILRCTRRAFVVLPYSCFRPRWLREALKETPAKIVYDPCAGWGERMLAVCASGAKYIGCDVNIALEPGYIRLIEVYGLSADLIFGKNAAENDMRDGKHDAVVCCPPYGAKERYSSLGAENMSQDDYVAWWKHVVEMAVSPTVKRFYLQIDKPHEETCVATVEEAGFMVVSREELYADVVRPALRKLGVMRRREPEVAIVLARR